MRKLKGQIVVFLYFSVKSAKRLLEKEELKRREPDIVTQSDGEMYGGNNQFDGNAAFSGGGFMPSQATQTAGDHSFSPAKVYFTSLAYKM